MNLRTFLASSVLAVALSDCSTAGGPASGQTTLKSRFAKADINNDGRVTRKEYGYSMIEEAFARYDTNRDGAITLEEFVALGGSPTSFRKIDKDGSGTVTLEEAKSAKLAMDSITIAFYGADTDKDGYVTLAEALAYREAARPYTR